MTKRNAGIRITIGDGSIVACLGDRTATFPAELDTAADVLVVDLDSAACFDAPHDEEELSVELLARITAAIEAACDEAGVEVEFE